MSVLIYLVNSKKTYTIISTGKNEWPLNQVIKRVIRFGVRIVTPKRSARL